MATQWLTESEARSRWGANRVDRLLDRDGDGMPDAGLLTTLIERAERHAAEVLLTRYDTTDLPSTPSTTSHSLKDIVAGIFWWYLHEGLDRISEAVVEVRDESFRRLARMSSSRAVMGLSSEPSIDQARPRILVAKGVTSRQMDADALEDW